MYKNTFTLTLRNSNGRKQYQIRKPHKKKKELEMLCDEKDSFQERKK